MLRGMLAMVMTSVKPKCSHRTSVSDEGHQVVCELWMERDLYGVCKASNGLFNGPVLGQSCVLCCTVKDIWETAQNISQMFSLFNC